LPGALRQAQQDFDQHLARTLERLADRLECEPDDSTDSLKAAFARLVETVQASKPAPEVRTFAVLSERITGLALSLVGSIQNRSNRL
jgi:hypothetical protein